MPKPLVSVCIVTYQHARFIAQCVEGALLQKTDFPVEIILGEDESNDGTREICLDYARRHPDRVRVSLRSRRDVVYIDGQPRGSFNLRMTLGEAEGEFIALCEGDDYWTDPEKLQRQVAYLQANPDCSGCFHDTKLVDGDGQTLLESYFQSDQLKFTQRDVLESLLSREPTCSLVFRRSALGSLPDWFLRRPSDLFLDLHLTGSGRLGFINRNMGAYRRHGGGIWSGTRLAQQIVELIIRYKILLQEPSFTSDYDDLILRKIAEFQSSLFTREDAEAEVQRLETVTGEQAALLTTIRRENNRLNDEADRARAEARRAIRDAQAHIDRLSHQIDKLAATARQQTNHITGLIGERDRYAAEGEAVRATLAHNLTIAQGHIDRLNRQVEHLVATSGEQSAYIAILQKELAGSGAALAQSRHDNTHYLAVIEEQNRYLATLRSQLGQPPKP